MYFIHRIGEWVFALFRNTFCLLTTTTTTNHVAFTISFTFFALQNTFFIPSLHSFTIAVALYIPLLLHNNIDLCKFTCTLGIENGINR